MEPDFSNASTAWDYLGLHRVDAACRHCDHIAELDLAILIGRGHGNTPLVKLPLRCQACGQAGHSIIISGKSYGLGEDLGG